MLLADVAWEPVLVEPRRDAGLERYAREQLGRVPHFLGYLVGAPWVARAVVRAALETRRLAHLDFALGELAALVVSYDNSCRYCYAESRTLLRVMGFGEERIARLEQDLFSAPDDPRVARALDVARRFSRANPLPTGAELAALEALGLGRGAVLELLVTSAIMVFANRVATLPALPPEPLERMASTLLFRLMRPLMARGLRARFRSAPVEPLAPERCAGPFAATVLALRGLPAASLLRDTLDECWSAPALSPRLRALVFAVVARGLGASAAERESLRLAEQAGLAPDEAAQALRRLASPALEPAESTALASARETLWYEPRQIQRRVRGLVSELGPDRFVDLAGTAGLANGICRLSAVLEPA
jgi:AhpD family alkylhydroperoxidase